MDARIDSFRAALDAQPVSRFQIRLVVMALLLMVMDGYDVQAIGYVAPVLTTMWKVDRSAFATVFSAGLIGLTIGTLIFSPISDRFGCRPVLIICTAMFGALTLATALVNSFGSLVVLRFLTGLGLGGAMPSVIALVTDYAPTRHRNLMVLISVIGFPIGGALGGFIGAFAIQSFGWQSVFVIGGIVPLVILPLIFVWLPETLPILLAEPSPRARLSKVVAQVAPGWTAPESKPSDLAAEKRFPVAVLFTRDYAIPTLLIWAVYICNLLLIYFFVNWTPILATQVGQTLQAANIAAGVFQLAGIVGGLLMSFLSDRTGRSQLIIMCASLGAAACCFVFGTAAHSTPGVLIAAAAAAGFCIVGTNGLVSAFVGRYYPATIRATGVGWGLGMGRLGSILGSIAGGVLLGLNVSMPTLFACFAVPAFIAAICIISIKRSPDLRPSEQSLPHGAAPRVSTAV